MGTHPWDGNDSGEAPFCIPQGSDPKKPWKRARIPKECQERDSTGQAVALAAKIWEWEWMELTLKDVEEQPDPEENQELFFFPE